MTTTWQLHEKLQTQTTCDLWQYKVNSNLENNLIAGLGSAICRNNVIGVTRGHSGWYLEGSRTQTIEFSLWSLKYEIFLLVDTSRIVRGVLKTFGESVSNICKIK